MIGPCETSVFTSTTSKRHASASYLKYSLNFRGLSQEKLGADTATIYIVNMHILPVLTGRGRHLPVTLPRWLSADSQQNQQMPYF